MSSNHFGIKRFRTSEIIIDQSLCFVLYLVYLKGRGEADYPENKETKKGKKNIKMEP